MDTLYALIAFLAFWLVCLVAMEWRERKRKRDAEAAQAPQADAADAEAGASEAADTEAQPDRLVRVPVDDECCGRHSVCERESLITTKPDIVYYDDEELDRLAGLPAEEYTEEDLAAVQEVFYTMQDKDVAGWLRSLQLRGITIPQQLLDEALMIVAERRYKEPISAEQ